MLDPLYPERRGETFSAQARRFFFEFGRGRPRVDKGFRWAGTRGSRVLTS